MLSLRGDHFIFHVARIKLMTFYSDKRILVFHVAKTPSRYSDCVPAQQKYVLFVRTRRSSRDVVVLTVLLLM